MTEEKLSAAQRRTMAPWQALVLVGAAHSTALVALTALKVPLSDTITYFLMGISAFSFFVVAGGEASGIVDVVKSKLPGGSK